MDQSLQNHLRDFLADNKNLEAALLSSGYQGTAYLYDQDGYEIVVKEAASGLLTGWFHRLMLRREARIYEHLAGVKGVPYSPGLLDGKWLVLDFVEARSLKEQRHELQDRDGFYALLREVIDAFHAVGIAHGDLKRKDNVLVDKLEQPNVIDFGTAVMRDGGFIDRLLYPLFVRFDHNAWIKAKYRFDTDEISAQDLDWHEPTWIEDSFRQLRRFWRTVTFRQARKRKRKRKLKRQSRQS
jgi:predicted Ser/Thr protein kinase